MFRFFLQILYGGIARLLNYGPFKRLLTLLIQSKIVFKISDYELNLNERIVKFKDYDLIICEKCNKKIDKCFFNCVYCYCKETDEKEKNYMKYGKCKGCLQVNIEYNWCLSCGFQIKKQNIIFFKSPDYELNLNERIAKFKDYDLTLCEKCNKKIDTSYYFYCVHCYHKETDEKEKNYMKYGKCKRCFQTRYNCCDFQNIKNQYIIFFKTSDYELDLNERKAKFKDYDLTLCEKCNKRIDSNHFYCVHCYCKKIDEIEKNYIKYGKCKKCFQARTENNWCSFCGLYGNKEQNIIFWKKSDYDLDLNERRKRRAKFKDYLILCENCNKEINNTSVICNNCYVIRKGCNIHEEYSYLCLRCRFRQDFDKWTSDNENIDILIQESQISAHDLFSVLEWIPYDRFKNVKFIAEGGFAKVYSATWMDGYIEDWKLDNWKRCGPLKVALKVLNNSSESISDDFLNEVKSLKIFPNIYSGVITFYGITREPTTQNYALVFKLEDSDLRNYLNQNYNLLTWERRLCIIQRICSGLRSIHNYGFIHKDFHIGNVLHSILNSQSFTYIGDFGFCIPANEISSKSNIYGVMPYMAPEILRRKPYTKASDIYSLGIIINEIISIIPPFNKEPHDEYLALDICRGRRPKIREETPEFLKGLIKKCWDANPENRPSSDEIDTSISDFIREIKLGINTKGLKELSHDSIRNKITNTNPSSTTQLFKTHPEAIYTSRLLNLPNLPEPINCQNQEEFVSSRNIARVQSGEVYILNSDECLDCKITD